MATVDLEKTTKVDQSDLLGVKPFNGIGSGRSTEETKSVKNKLLKNKVRAEGSTSQSGEKANVGEVTGAIKNFVNR